MMIRCVRLHFAIAVLATVVTAPAWSNGDLFFEAQEIPGKIEYVVFGNVKDDKGRYLEGANVTVSVTEPRLAYTSQTDVIGRFRSLDIGRAIKGLGYDVDPSLIEVTVTYPGYRVVRRLYRGKYRQSKGVVEVNFILSEDGK